MLGWLAYLLVTPLQVSADLQTMGMMGGSGAAAIQDAHMPMGNLSAQACMQLQCHAAPAVVARVAQAAPFPVQPVAVAVSSPDPYQVTATQVPGPAAHPPLRPAPVLYLRPARLLI